MSEDAEQAVLGACLSNRNALGVAVDQGLKPSHFASGRNALIFAAMLKAQEDLGREEALDPLLVARHLGGGLEEVGGLGYLWTLGSLVVVATNVRQYAQDVMGAAVERDTRRLLDELLQSDLRGPRLLEALQERAYCLESPRRQGATIRQALEEVFLAADKPRKATCSFPWREVEFCTRGLRPGGLYILAAETGQGKTAAAIEVTDHNASAGRRVLFVSLEMTPAELAVRLAQRYGFNPEPLYGQREPNAEEMKALSTLIGQECWDRVTVETVERVDELGALIRLRRPDLVIVDYLQLLDVGRYDRVEGTTRNSNALKRLARRYEVPILALSQLSRGQHDERGKPPGLWRLRNSGALEQDADAVIFIWRERTETETLSDLGAFVVAKARMGTLGKVRFRFSGQEQRFHLLRENAP